MHNLPFILLGLGDQGCRGLITLLRIQEQLRLDGITLSINVLADPAEDKQLHKKVLKSVLGSVREPVELFNTISDWRAAHQIDCQQAHLVYDATPSTLRPRNVGEVFAHHNLVYLAEKPLAVSRQQLEDLKRLLSQAALRLYCNLIDTQSLPALLAFSFIRQKRWRNLKRLRFWRESSVGIQKLREPSGRTGVTGGALEDKIVHDIALALLFVESVYGHKPVEVCSRHIQDKCFMPSSLETAMRCAPLFRTPLDDTTEDLTAAADAIAHLAEEWKVQGQSSTINLEFHGSWFGVSPGLTTELRRLGITNETSWLVSKAGSDEEARIAIIDGVTDDGNEETLIISFMPKHQWVEVKPVHEALQSLQDCLRSSLLFGENSLARVFRSVALNTFPPLHVTTTHQASTHGLDAGFALLVHDHLMDMRDQLQQATRYTTPPQEATRIYNVLQHVLSRPRSQGPP